MAIHRFWQGRNGTARLAVMAAVIPLAMAAGRLGAGEDWRTPRQAEILHELLTLRPPGDAAEGAWMLRTWDSDSGLEEFVPLPRAPGNAAANFRRLEELYPAEKDALAADPAGTHGVLELLTAAATADCRLAPEYYPEFDRVTAKQPDFLVARAYLKGLLVRAERAEAGGDGREAENCLRAALLCGRHLTRDKPSVLVYMTGVIFKLRGAEAYERFLRRANRPDAADAAGRYRERMAGLLRFFYWKANTALSDMDGFACLPAAMEIAARDMEPAWRKEASIRLAILRHGIPAPSGGGAVRDAEMERRAEEALAKTAESDPDPGVRRLAAWAIVNLRPDQAGEAERAFSAGFE